MSIESSRSDTLLSPGEKQYRIPCDIAEVSNLGLGPRVVGILDGDQRSKFGNTSAVWSDESRGHGLHG